MVKNYVTINKGVYKELSSICSMLGCVKLTNSYSIKNNYFHQLADFNLELGSKKKTVLYYEDNLKDKDSFIYEFGNELNGSRFNYENLIGSNKVVIPTTVVDEDNQVINNYNVGGLEEIRLKNMIASINKNERSVLLRTTNHLDVTLIPLDKRTFEFKNEIVENRHSSNDYELEFLYSNSDGKYLEYTGRVEAVNKPGNDCIINRFYLPFSTKGNIIGLNDYNLIYNREALNLHKELERTQSRTSFGVKIKSKDNFDYNTVDEYKELLNETLNKIDIPNILLEDENAKDFRKQLRNLDKARMIFHLHLDKSDNITGISSGEYFYKDVDNIVSLIRPLTISDSLIESIFYNIELIDFILFTIKDLKYSDCKFLKEKDYNIFFSILNAHDYAEQKDKDKFLTTYKNYSKLIDYCCDIVTPYILNLGETGGFYKGVSDGYISRSKMFGLINRNGFIMEMNNDKAIEEYKKSIKTFYTPIKELEYRVRTKMLKILLKNGIRYSLSNLEAPTNLLEVLLSKLNNKIIVIDFIKLNLDEKYEDSRISSTSCSLFNYYTKTKFDNEEFNIIGNNLKELREKTRDIYLDFNSREEKDTIYNTVIGGSYTHLFSKRNLTDVLEADGYFCSILEQNREYSTSLFRSGNYFRTTFIDTEECGLDSNYPIMFEENLGLLFYKLDRDNLNKFLSIKNPRNNKNQDCVYGEFFSYYGDGPTLYIVNHNGVNEIRPIKSSLKSGLFRNVYKNGLHIVKDELVIQDDYTKFNITTSKYLADNIYKFQEKVAGLSNVEYEDRLQLNKINLIEMSMKEKILEHKIFVEDTILKHQFNVASKVIDIEGKLTFANIEQNFSLANLKIKEQELLMKHDESLTKKHITEEMLKSDLRSKKVSNALTIAGALGKTVGSFLPKVK